MMFKNFFKYIILVLAVLLVVEAIDLVFNLGGKRVLFWIFWIVFSFGVGAIFEEYYLK